jgi:hypothetical protein
MRKTKLKPVLQSVICNLLSAICLPLLAGCVTMPQKSSGPTQIPMLEPATLFKFSDLPIPANFVFAPDESYAFQSVGFRAGLLRYKGKATGEKAIVFFREQMPLYDWRLVNIVEHGRRTISFEKESETCLITIDEKRNKAELTISIAPKSQLLRPKSDKPIR